MGNINKIRKILGLKSVKTADEMFTEEGLILGKYKTKERVKDILMDIRRRLVFMNQDSNDFYVYEMSEE